MEEETKTQEEVQASITAAFDSVNLINGIIDGSQMANESTSDKQDTVDRNVAHLEIMKAKTWFSDGLTDQQETDIDAAIAAGKAYSA
tara:strand:+ start:221 stop:481 length:261 start_codon:yes stop_codon:yes gene_type:complete